MALQRSLTFIVRFFPAHLHARLYSVRHANLGRITEYLTRDGIPNFLQKPFNDSYIDDEIRLRLLPTTHPYFPELKGRTKYKASINAIRLLTNKLVLTRTSQLRVNSVLTLSKDNKDSMVKEKQYNCCTKNDKLVIKWQSCSSKEECEKLLNNDKGKITTFPKMEDFKSPILDYVLDPSSKPVSGDTVTAHVGPMNQYETGDNASSRIIKGIFILEFNDDNSRILVHTFEDVEMIDFDKKIPTEALAC